MNIQRKYSLPNCTLLLEGLSDAARAAHFQELRPQLSILVNAECYLTAYSQPLTGGREFFESLVRAVNAYAQEFLSSIPNPDAHNFDSELVQFQKIDQDQHRMFVKSETPGQMESNGKHPIEIDLNTVQLFDLVEAVDQFFADSQTLSELTLELQPMQSQHGNVSQMLIKQAVPASVGVTSLAVAAIAFGLIPSPKVNVPQPQTQNAASKTSTNTNNNSNPLSNAISNTPLSTPRTTIAPTPVSTSRVTDLDALLNSKSEITDSSELHALNRQVYNLINPAWNNRSALDEDLIYRVGVGADGAIVGYKALNQGANTAASKTPLPKLAYNASTSAFIANEPVGQFRVVFTRQGVLQVSPWRGYNKTPQVIGQKITDPKTLQNLHDKLYNTVRQSWTDTPNFKQDLKYRVAVNKDGVIADYEPLNQVAYDDFRETPLPKIFQATYGSNVATAKNKEPLAHYQVTFKSNGALEVNPWQGYR